MITEKKYIVLEFQLFYLLKRLYIIIISVRYFNSFLHMFSVKMYITIAIVIISKDF